MVYSCKFSYICMCVLILYVFDLINVIKQAGYAPAQHRDLVTWYLLVRGQVYVGGVVYKHYVILYNHHSRILFIIQYTEKFYCIPCCQEQRREGLQTKRITHMFVKRKKPWF